jgi:hypothetical protein
VDIDTQAVEVAQLSLYLKLLQEETPGSTRAHQLEFHETLLPSLNKNITCGNSLIGTDIFAGELFEPVEERKLNPMDFEQRFPEIMKRGGFDAIVGNPPYIRMEEFKSLKDYLRKHYAVYEERADFYGYFIEREHKRLRIGGRFGMIVSNKFLRSNYGKPIREFLRKSAQVEHVVDFAGLPVFKGATVRTIVLLTSRQEKPSNRSVSYMPPPTSELFDKIEAGLISVQGISKSLGYEVSGSTLADDVWSFPRKEVEDLLAKLRKDRKTLGKVCNGEICMGIKSGLSEAFVIDEATRRRILVQNPAATEIIKPYLGGREIRRYFIESNGRFLIYTYHGVPIKKYPAVEKHLETFRSQLKNRATKQAWYELQQPQLNFSGMLDKPKLIFPDIATEPRFALDESGAYGSNTTYFIGRRDLPLLALLNSTVAKFYFKTICAGLEGKGETYLRFFGQYLNGFPIPTSRFSKNN